MLKLLDITKEYTVEEESVLALNNVSIEFRKNEFVSILGPSGCGKTTLLNIVGGLDRYTSGDIQIDTISTKEYDDVDWDTYRNRRIGFVFQSYNLIPHMNILKNVSMSLTLAGVESEERKTRALEALRKVGLEAQAKKKPNQLSGGQMQRVAIARALVNNPEIILADEPTGALDSESGIQVMDLLKEVAEDRLVIMVTHNPSLAEEYSTRIVYLKDGEIVGDTKPYSSEDEESEIIDEKVDGIAAENTVEAEKSTIEVKGEDAKPKKKSLREKFRKWRKAERAGMKLGTAINLSWNNLLAKKGRTLLTSIAGSIGIIGIVLVLSLSNGASAYVRSLEESALSTYPLTVNKSSLDVSSLMQDLMGLGGGSSNDKEVNDNEITAELVLGNLAAMFTNPKMQKTNDLHALKQKIDTEFDHSLATVKYNYGTSFNVYVDDPKSDANYMKTTPYSENMYSLFDYFNQLLGGQLTSLKIDVMGQQMTISDAMAYLSGMIGDPWAEISENTALVNSQYEVVGGKWPEKANEVVVVVNEDNTLFDYQLFMLGLKSSADLGQLLINKDAFVAKTYTIDDILGLEYKLMSNVDYLDKMLDDDGNVMTNGNGVELWTMGDKSTLEKEYVDARAMKFADGTDTVKVVGVVRPKKGAIASSIGGVIGYTKQLTDALLAHSQNHEAVKTMQKLYDDAVATLDPNDDKDTQTSYESVIEIYRYTYSDATPKPQYIVKAGDEVEIDTSKPDSNDHAEIMRELGFIDKEYPQSIEFYCSSFDAKGDVAKFLSDNDITYSDSLSTMMEFVNTMVNTITGVLVGFAAISLIVSTIMIAIIIYTSVLERRKEIGVLRSIGARKRDISRVFIAESAILGGYSGFIGIIFSVIVCVIGSVIIEWKLGIENLVSVSWWQCLVMFFVSIILSVLAGFIPSRIAAKKDPAIALRSE